ncbi:hypothetical protein MKY95_10260 [Paenibacillus sp. FSL P4-0176]|uniref:hypothetical protein n=1 Tax=Paenibacillus sp. FSL P4-0176 TaxID=2921631 RepID=UPI0030CF7099
MSAYYIQLIILVTVVGGMFAIPLARDRGWINIDKTKEMQQKLFIFRFVLEVINVKRFDKNSTTFALDIADVVTDYVDTMMNDSIDKKAVSLKIIEDLLVNKELTITVSEWRLIEIIIDETIKR